MKRQKDKILRQLWVCDGECGGEVVTNEERLSRLCTYDLLMRIRRGLQAGPCLIDILSSDTVVNKRCTPDTSCPECIAKWLGEEAHNDS